MTDLSRAIWLESSGGPMIVGTKAVVLNWHGIHGSMGFKNSSDYDAAASVSDEIAMIDIKENQAIVLGDEPDRMCVLQPSNCVFMVIRWKYANDALDILTHALDGQSGSADWQEEFIFDMNEDNIVLMDASTLFEESDCKYAFFIQPGFYKVETAYLEPNADTAYVCHRFTLLKQ